MELSKFLGRQIARLKFARDYFTIILTSLTAISTTLLYIKSIGIELGLEYYLFALIFILVTFWLVGYIVDKSKIKEYDQQRTIIQGTSGTIILWEELMDQVIIPKLRELKEEVRK